MARSRTGDVATLVALIPLIAIVLAGCAQSTDPTAPHAPESASPVPVVIQPTADATDDEYVPFPAELQVLADMQDLAEFAAQPKDLLRQYGAFIATHPMETNLGVTLAEFEESYAKESKNPIDQLPVASKENSAQEILQVSGANTRYSFALSGIDRNKYLIAMLQYGADSDPYRTLAPKFEEYPDNAEGWTLATKNDLPIGSAVDSTGVQESDGSAGITADRITYVSAQDGKTYEQVFYYNEIKLPDGTKYATWFL